MDLRPRNNIPVNPHQDEETDEDTDHDDREEEPQPAAVIPRPGQQLPPPPPLHQHQPNQNLYMRQAPVQYIKNLATFKNGSDLLIFLHRFNSYCQALTVPRAMMASLLIAHLDDTSLRGISRHLNDDLTYEEIVELLKKSQGYDANNTEKHITEMAARKRLKTEKVMDFFVDMSRISELAYPNPHQRAIRDANLRQEFIKNINHPMIAARLRENPNMVMEELLDFAILLESCYEASKVPPNHVNFVDTSQDDIMNTKITNLTNLMEKMVLNQVEQERGTDAPYQYKGDMTPRALQQNDTQDQRGRSTNPHKTVSDPWYDTQADTVRRSQSYEYRPRDTSRDRYYSRQNREDRSHFYNRNVRSHSPGYRNNTIQPSRSRSWQPYNQNRYNIYNHSQGYRNRGNRNNEGRDGYNGPSIRPYNNNNNDNRNNPWYNNRDQSKLNHIQNFRRGARRRQIT